MATKLDIVGHAQGVVRGMKQAGMDPPYILTIPPEVGASLDEVYDSAVSVDVTVRQRLLDIPGIEEVRVGEKPGQTTVQQKK